MRLRRLFFLKRLWVLPEGPHSAHPRLDEHCALLKKGLLRPRIEVFSNLVQVVLDDGLGGAHID